MKKIIFILLLQVLVANLFAHKHGHGTPSQSWELKNKIEVIHADFIPHRRKNGLF